MYVRFTTIAHASLTLVSWPAAHARRLWAFLDVGPLPSCSPVSSPPLGVLSRSSALYKVRTIGREALLNVQRLTARKPRPGSIRPRNDPVSASPMYVRFTTIAHGSLTLVSRPAAHARRLSAFHGPWPPPLLLAGFFAAPRRAIKVLCTLRGAYDRLECLAEYPTAYSPKTSPRPIRPRNDPGSASPMYVRFITIAHASLRLVSWPTARAQRLSAFHGPWPPPLLLAGFSTAPRRAIKVLRTLQGAYDRLRGLGQCPMAYNLKTPPRHVWTV